jgi:hypothetical protein
MNLPQKEFEIIDQLHQVVDMVSASPKNILDRSKSSHRFSPEDDSLHSLNSKLTGWEIRERSKNDRSPTKPTRRNEKSDQQVDRKDRIRKSIESKSENSLPAAFAFLATAAPPRMPKRSQEPKPEGTSAAAESIPPEEARWLSNHSGPIFKKSKSSTTKYSKSDNESKQDPQAPPPASADAARSTKMSRKSSNITVERQGSRKTPKRSRSAGGLRKATLLPGTQAPLMKSYRFIPQKYIPQKELRKTEPSRRASFLLDNALTCIQEDH